MEFGKLANGIWTLFEEVGASFKGLFLFTALLLAKCVEKEIIYCLRTLPVPLACALPPPSGCTLPTVLANGDHTPAPMFMPKLVGVGNWFASPLGDGVMRLPGESGRLLPTAREVGGTGRVCAGLDSVGLRWLPTAREVTSVPES